MRPGTRRRLAWGVHLYTALGAVLAWGAILSISDGRFRLAFTLLTVALVVDASDGMLARAARVREFVPEYDGAGLDNIVDYQTYVTVPLFLLWKWGALTGVVGATAATLALLASAYRFCHADAKTEDHYFTGFPSYWNLVAFYVVLFDTPPWANALLIAGLAGAVLAPLRFIYPSRTLPFRRLSVGLGVVWGAFMLALLARFPHPDPQLTRWSLLYPAYYVALSFWLQFRSRPAG